VGDSKERETVPGTPTVRLAERISEQIRDWILDGRYMPGDKLPPERRLASLLGVNRGSLRLALKKLEQLGLLQSRQGDGTRVRDAMQDAGIALLPHVFRAAVARDREVLEDVLQLRVRLCSYLAGLAALRTSAEGKARIRAIVERMEQCSRDPAAMLQLDFDLYGEYARSGRSFVGQLLLNTIRDAFERNANLFTPLADDPAWVISAARRVGEAIEDSDGPRAEREAAAYLAEGLAKAMAAAGPASSSSQPSA